MSLHARTIPPLAVALLFFSVPARAAIPTANAGGDQTYAFGTIPKLVTLSGSGVDPDGGAITAYAWPKIEIPPGSSPVRAMTVLRGRGPARAA